MPDLKQKVIICEALAGPFTMKHQNPAVPYTLREFADEAAKCNTAGAAMVHVHDGMTTVYPLTRLIASRQPGIGATIPWRN